MTTNRDARVWAVAKGGELEVKDNNLPAALSVQPNKVGPLDAGAWPYFGPKEAISKMTVHQNMKVNLFASEEMFPRLINPVQMSVDADSRLWCRGLGIVSTLGAIETQKRLSHDFARQRW